MSSSLRVLRQPTVPGMGSASPSLPQRSVEEIEATARLLGIEEGKAQAVDQMIAATDAIRIAIRTQQAELRAEYERQQVELVRLAVELAEMVLGHANHDDGQALAGRLAEVMQMLDDTNLTVAVNPADIELLDTLGMGDIEITVDHSLRPGEARVVGDWANTDLTFSGALAVLQRSVGGA